MLSLAGLGQPRRVPRAVPTLRELGMLSLPLCSPAPAQPFVFAGSSALFIFPKCHLPSPPHATPPKK